MKINLVLACLISLSAGLTMAKTFQDQDQVLPQVVAQSAAAPWPVAMVPVGTGFFVTNNGKIVSAAHVVAGCRAIEALSPDGKVSKAILIGLDSRSDLALLNLPHVHAVAASFARTHDVASGEKLTVSGYGQEGHNTSERVPISVMAAGTVINVVNFPLLRLSGPIKPGMSGSPVLDARGQVRGMVIGKVSSDTEHAVALQNSEILNFIRYFSVKWRVAKSNLSSKSKAGINIQSTTLVQCAG